MLVSATGCHRSEGFGYALDNGAWTAYQSGARWDAGKFLALLDTHGAGADWAVLPDIVGGGAASLAWSLDWRPRVQPLCPRWLLAVQDGMSEAEVGPHVGEGVGVFVGGSTAWKLATLAGWARLARERGAWCHVGRVNSARRIRVCRFMGVDSFDGTSATRFAVTLPALDRARRGSPGSEA